MPAMKTLTFGVGGAALAGAIGFVYAQATTAGGEAIYNLVITGSFLTIVPIVGAFLFLQRFWQSGLSAGSVK